MSSLQLRNINKTYPNHIEAIKDFNLELGDKEFLILVGPSGCGKTTVLRMIAGLEQVTSGELILDGQCINELEPKDRNLSMVFQSNALFPHMTVFDNIAFGLKYKGYTQQQIEVEVQKVAKILELESLLKRRPTELSGGQNQRVSIGRAIVRNPKILLMDEPLSSLDAKLRVQMRVEISKLHKRLENTIVYVTHDQTEALTLGTRVVVMKDGLIQQVGTPKEVYQKPSNLFVAGFIGNYPMNFLDAEVKSDGISIFLTVNQSKIKLIKEQENALRNYVGKKIAIGIRPEALFINDNNLTECNKLIGTVSLYELIGAEAYLYVDCNGNTITIRVNASDEIQTNKKIDLHFESASLHMFDKDTEERIGQ